MSVEEITADAVREAMAEHDEVGIEKFCRKYGFSLERAFVVRASKKRYGTRVLLAAAHGRLPGQQPLASHAVPDDSIVTAVLQRLGFDVVQVQPPAWTRDELILACSLLFNNDRKALHANKPPVVELSGQLKSMRIHRPEDRGGNFRSPGSVAAVSGSSCSQVRVTNQPSAASEGRKCSGRPCQKHPSTHRLQGRKSTR